MFLAAILLSSVPADVVALGIVLSRRPERSVAVLRAEGRTRIVGVGGTAFGGRVAEIGPRSVALEFGTRRVEVALVGAGEPAPPRAAAAPEPDALRPGDPPEDPATPVRAMERGEIERRLADEAPRILAETTLLPVTEGGNVVGFTLTRMPESSLLSDAGLRPGDILTRVNDVPLDSMATLIALWPRLQQERVLRAVVIRNGQPVSLGVVLR
jgi:type II secretion system protein C